MESFFLRLAERLNSENNLSDMTWALCLSKYKYTLTFVKKYGIHYNMRWQEESLRSVIFDHTNSLDIIADAYNEGYINWIVYQKARERVASNRNGSWMFEQNVKKNK